MKHVRITGDSGIPLIGCIAFGIIDRGSNLVQVRPGSSCNLKCVYCSTRSGDTDAHPVGYEVDKDYLLGYVKEVAKYKGVRLEAHIDSVGEVMLYKDIIPLIKGLGEMDSVKFISMQTNGCLFTRDKLEKLSEAGLGRINLSINALDAKMARTLSGVTSYNVGRIVKLARMIAESEIELLLAPLWMPGLNDREIEKLVILSKELGCRIGIQNYEVYKHSRKARGVKPVTYWRFYKKLEKLEKQHGVKLILSAREMEVCKAKRLPLKFDKGERVQLEVRAPGWWKGQMVAVGRNRCVTINDCSKKEGQLVNVKILENKNNIYIAEEA